MLLSWSLVGAQGEHGRIRFLACVTSFTDKLLITPNHTAFGNQLAEDYARSLPNVRERHRGNHCDKQYGLYIEHAAAEKRSLRFYFTCIYMTPTNLRYHLHTLLFAVTDRVFPPSCSHLADLY